MTRAHTELMLTDDSVKIVHGGTLSFPSLSVQILDQEPESMPIAPGCATSVSFRADHEAGMTARRSQEAQETDVRSQKLV
jgi:hypothetical protein